MTKEGRHEYANAVGIAAAHNLTEPWRVVTAVTNDAARSGMCVDNEGFARQHVVNSKHACCRSVSQSTPALLNRLVRSTKFRVSYFTKRY